jgi:hypothetical protein
MIQGKAKAVATELTPSAGRPSKTMAPSSTSLPYGKQEEVDD